MYNLYVLKHPVTDEIRYVGRTSYTIETRLKAHLSHCRGGSTVHRCNWINSLVNQGLTPKVEFVSKHETWEESGQAEINLIRKLKSEGIDLVNKTEGGDGYLRGRVKQFDLNGNFIKLWDSISVIESELGLSNSHISSCCNGRYGRKSVGNFIWRYEKDEFLTHSVERVHIVTEEHKKILSDRMKGNTLGKLGKGKSNPKAYKKFYLLDELGNVIKTYNSRQEIYLEYDRGAFNYDKKLKRYYSYGLKLQLIAEKNYSSNNDYTLFTEEYKLKRIERSKILSKRQGKVVLQYNLKGDFIKEWENCVIAGNTLNVSIGSIRVNAQGRSITAGGYKWKYKNNEEIVRTSEKSENTE